MESQSKIPMPHLGQQLKIHFKKKRIYKAALARIMGKQKSGIQRYFTLPSLQATTLWDLSWALKHNFIMDLAAQLPPEFTTNAPDATLPLQAQVADLKKQNELLTAKVETLMTLARK